jgi:hypothetical protein
MIALLTVAFVMTAAPRNADAALRLGVDGLWMPLAFQNIEDDKAELDSDHELASFGVAAHANLGFDIFSLGLKVNYFSQSITFPGTVLSGESRFKELDINLMGRIGIPATDVAIFAEAGPTTNPGFDYFGYNFGAGIEYDLLGLPLLDLNVGAMGQYVNVSDVEFSFGGLEKKANVSEGRLMLFVGADFSI